MKKTFALLTILILAISVGFVKENPESGKKEDRNLSGFSQVDLSISGNLYYTQGKNYEVVIDASDDDLETIETTVDNGTLKIKSKNCWTCNLKDVKIYVRSPEMNGLRVSGSGSIYAENDIQTGDMTLKVSGSGKIHLKSLKAEDIDAAISGSGNVDILKGNAATVETRISGSGSFDAENLQVNVVDAKISGSGSCRIHAGDKLTAKISGSGNIYYKGQPKMDVASSGSGRVKAL